MEGRAATRPVESAAPAALLASRILASLAESLPETRVRAFDFSAATRTEAQWLLTDGAHRSSSTFSCAFASDLVGFLSEDPLAGKLGRSAGLVRTASDVYSYVNNLPIDSVDPLGLRKCPMPSQCTVPCVGCCLDRLRSALCQLKNVKSAEKMLGVVDGVEGVAKGVARGSADAAAGACVAFAAKQASGDARNALIGEMGADAMLLLPAFDCFKTCDNFPCMEFPNSPCPFLRNLTDLARRNLESWHP